MTTAPPAPSATATPQFQPPQPSTQAGLSHVPFIPRWITLLLIGLLASGVVAVGIWRSLWVQFSISTSSNSQVQQDKSAQTLPTVKVVRPRKDPDFQVSVRQFATVEAFYQVSLRSRVTGNIQYITKDIGDPVRAGELLIAIDAPDLEQAVQQKMAILHQRQQEVEVMEKQVKLAQLAVEAAQLAVQQKLVEVERAHDVWQARKIDLIRVEELVRRGSLLPDRLDAMRLEYQSALRSLEEARVAVAQARIDERQKIASLERVQAELQLKQAALAVARKELDLAVVVWSFSHLYAPFDGTIITRDADPGKFVAGSTTNASEPLLTVARTDLVTVVVKVPDNVAPYVSSNTKATIEFTQLPGIKVTGPITRFSPYIDPSDQTLRIEIDIYNGTIDQYQENLLRWEVPPLLSGLIYHDPVTAWLSACRSYVRTRLDHKGWRDRPPLMPDWGANGKKQPILPGMTGMVRLDLQRFANTYLLPATAIYERAGQNYLLVVEQDVTREVPVEVQINDGRLAKVAIQVWNKGKRTTQELTGQELIVTSRQAEIGPRRRVHPVLQQW
jgi:multidrug resistance efflux pump